MKNNFTLINRHCFILIPKKPFIEWIKGVEKILGNDSTWLDDWDVRQDRNVYLIDEYEMKDDVEKHLKNNFEMYFAYELYEWYTDTELWPKDITFEMFREWFDIEFHSMVHDILKTNLEKETL